MDKIIKGIREFVNKYEKSKTTVTDKELEDGFDKFLNENHVEFTNDLFIKFKNVNPDQLMVDEWSNALLAKDLIKVFLDCRKDVSSENISNLRIFYDVDCIVPAIAICCPFCWYNDVITMEDYEDNMKDEDVVFCHECREYTYPEDWIDYC